VPSVGGAATYDVDPVHSNVGFAVRHMGISTVHGKFKMIKGTVEFDPKAPEKLSLTAEADAASINTENPKRDEHLQSPDFFDAAKNPKITFKSKKTKVVSAGKYEVTGDLTMRGVTKE